jgi:hypothetical protein
VSPKPKDLENMADVGIKVFEAHESLKSAKTKKGVVIDDGSSSSSSSSSSIVAPSGGLLQWKQGYNSWNATPRIFPIDKIWYNDVDVRTRFRAFKTGKSVGRNSDGNNGKKSGGNDGKDLPARKDLAPGLGWLEKLLLGFHRTDLSDNGVTDMPLRVPNDNHPFALNLGFTNNVVHTGNTVPDITEGAYSLRLVGPHEDVLLRAIAAGSGKDLNMERLDTSFHSTSYHKSFSTLEELLDRFWVMETM